MAPSAWWVHVAWEGFHWTTQNCVGDLNCAMSMHTLINPCNGTGTGAHCMCEANTSASCTCKRTVLVPCTPLWKWVVHLLQLLSMLLFNTRQVENVLFHASHGLYVHRQLHSLTQGSCPWCYVVTQKSCGTLCWGANISLCTQIRASSVNVTLFFLTVRFFFVIFGRCFMSYLSTNNVHFCVFQPVLCSHPRFG